MGEALKQDPGFLKLRKIRAAQRIAKLISDAGNNRVCFSLYETSLRAFLQFVLLRLGALKIITVA